MALMSLFIEYTVEMAYPVPEEIAAGFLNGGYNIVIVIFLYMFLIKNIGYLWINHVERACAIQGIIEADYF